VRAVAGAHGVSVPLELFVGAGILEPALPFEFPALIKLNCGDGSLGITPESVVHNAKEVSTQLARLRAEFPEHDVLVQEFLSGPEYSVGLIGNPGLGFTILPLLEVDYRRLDPQLPRILSYESKCDPQSLYGRHIAYREARLDERARQRLIDDAGRLFKRLGCRDYARFDFRADANGHNKLLDVNPNPAWCWDTAFS
jgi:D-alanine-D-alanine ligase